MTSLRKSIGGAILGLALAGALGVGVTEIYASAVSTDAADAAASICPLQKQAADTCPLKSSADCPKKANHCPDSAKGA